MSDIKANKDHNRYLNRMALSANESTKYLLPSFFEGKKRILDVGCADGVMMEKLQELNPNAEILGIDLCKESINTAREKGLNAIYGDIRTITTGYKFDGILFSSVLHEISSYDENKPGGIIPIYRALVNAREMLTDDGIIIIRDGVKDTNSQIIPFALINKDDEHFIKDYIRNVDKKMLKNAFSLNVFNRINEHLDDYCFHYYGGLYAPVAPFYALPQNVLKEFLFTYTWGEASWDREIQEVFGILTTNKWIQTVSELKMNIDYISTSSEKYIEKIKEKVHIYNDKKMTLENMFRESTITMILSKKK